jgi:hypothetical protein
MYRIATVAVAAIISVGTATAAIGQPGIRCADPVQRYQPASGMVASRSVALDIARTYLSTIYGQDQTKSEMPLKAELRMGVWHVEGSLKPGRDGGVAEIEICKSNGRVLSVMHGK